MTIYREMYRFAIRPWERYGEAARASIAALFDREEASRARPLGRALDLGCGRGQYTPELARRGWEAVGVDYVPAAIEAASRRKPQGVTYVVGDVTALSAHDLGGTFDFFLDVGCFQGLTAPQQQAQGLGVTALANPHATLLLLAFSPTRAWSFLGAAAQEDVERAFPAWQLLAVDPADTAGLGWPLNTTTPRWYRLGLRPPSHAS